MAKIAKGYQGSNKPLPSPIFNALVKEIEAKIRKQNNR